MLDVSIPNVSESFTRTIEQAWNRTLAVAQNHVQAYNEQNRSSQQDTQSNQPNNEFYNRERHMMEALDTLFNYAHDGPGFLAFIQTLTIVLDSDSPVAMAFLSHVIERSSLPSKKTIQSVSPVILSTMMKTSNQLKQKNNNSPLLQKMFKSFYFNNNKHYNNNDHDHNNNSKTSTTGTFKLKLNATIIWSILAEKYAGDMCMYIWNDQVGRLLIGMLADVNEDIMVRLFALIALEKFSLTGTVKNLILETTDIQKVLLQILKECEIANNKYYTASQCINEDHQNGLETLPLPRKQISSDNSITAQDLYWNSEHNNNRSNNNSNSSNNHSTRWGVLKHLLQNTTRILKRNGRGNHHEKNTQSITTSQKISSSNNNNININKKDGLATKKENHDHDRHQQQSSSMIEDKIGDIKESIKQNENHKENINNQNKNSQKINETSSSSSFLPSSSSTSVSASASSLPPSNSSSNFLPMEDDNDLVNSNFNSSSNLSLSQYSSNSFSTLNVFDTGFIPPPGPMRDEWAKYIQLAFCARWALENVFNQGKEVFKPNAWDLKNLRTIMNPFDATSHWKIGSSGLELRNDRPHFESIRATASVKTGKWYYETLLLSSGIMQLGWATSRCRFTPEEGYGVGDDCNGFAFDTYRTAVWADGTAVYPQSTVKIRCRAGDVLGSYLDLDNGSCSYYINGKDLGLTIEFENPAKQAEKANAAAAAAMEEKNSLINITDEANSIVEEEKNVKQQLLNINPSLENDPSLMSASTLNSLSTSQSTQSQNDDHHYRPQQVSSYNTCSDTLSGSHVLETSSLSQQKLNDDKSEEEEHIVNVIDEQSNSTNTPTVTIINESTSSNNTKSSSSSSSDITQQQNQNHHQSSEVKSAKGLGLYPAVSLTTHQHILMNLGDRPWIYPPPIPNRYRGICEAGQLDDKYKKRVSKWVSQRGYRMRKSHLAENNTPIRPKLNKSLTSNNNFQINVNQHPSHPYHHNETKDDLYLASSPLSYTSTTSSDTSIEYDWDGPMCTICFSEPKNTILLPCNHGGIGEKCAKILDLCHLCRANIEDRVIKNDNENN